MKKLILFFFFISYFFFLSILSDAQTPNWLWAKCSAGTDDNKATIAVDALGNTYIAGWFFGTTISFGSIILTNMGWDDIFLAKYDANGNVLWAKSIGGAGWDAANSIAVNASGEVYITGFFSSQTITFGSITLTTLGEEDIFLAKYDANGNVLWAKSAGSIHRDWGYSVAVDITGYVYITGQYGSNITFGSTNLSSGNLFITKYDANGNVIWAKSPSCIPNSTGSSGGNWITASVDASGNIYVTGNFVGSLIFGTTTLTNTSAGDTKKDLFLAKYDVSGNVLWAKSATGTSTNNAYSVATDVSGNVYVTGAFESTIIFGSTTLTNYGYSGAFLVKFDANGNVIWAKNPIGPSRNEAYSVASDASGSAYITGYFAYSAITFDAFTLANYGNSGEGNMFLAKYNSNGNVVWAKSADEVNYAQARSVAVNSYGNSYVTGFFNDTITLGTNTLTNNGYTGIFLAKLDNTTGITEVYEENSFNIFPNPSTDNLIIEFPLKSEIEILNIDGQLIKCIIANNNQISVDISIFPRGLYFAKFTTEKGVVVKKFVKE